MNVHDDPMSTMAKHGAVYLIISILLLIAGVRVTSLLSDMLDLAQPQPVTVATVSDTPPPAPTDSDSNPGLDNALIILGIIVVALAIIFLAWILVRRIRRDIAASRAERQRINSLRATQASTWKKYEDDYDKVVAQVLATEVDWDTIFFKPSLNDTSIPVVGKAWSTYHRVASMDRTFPSGLNPETDVTTLSWPTAVTELVRAWKAADDYATKIGQKRLPPQERKTIKAIRMYLKIAEGDGASENERQSAYRQIHKLTQKLTRVTIPNKARTLITEGAKPRRLIEA